jgi:hypothetical protein
VIRAHRIAAQAMDDASLVAGWNLAPNVSYVLHLLPGAEACGVLLYNEDESTLVASGGALTGAEQPCVLVPWPGQAIGMVDADLGWHLLLTTVGTESRRTIRITPAVDLPDEVHPVYADDAMAVAKATATIDSAAHYVDEVTVTVHEGPVVRPGEIAEVVVDGQTMRGQVESVVFEGTPDGATETITMRCYVPIKPEVFIEPDPPVLPVVLDDAGTTEADKTTLGNVLINDEAGLMVVAVNGLVANVGQPVAGSNGGTFVVAANGAWSFDPGGAFITLAGDETEDTSVMYHASSGAAEAGGTLTVIVTAPANPMLPDDRWGDVVFCINASGEDGSTNITDAKGLPITRNGEIQIDTEAVGYPVIQYMWQSDDYLKLDNSPSTKIESGVFTFDCWFNVALGGARAFLSNRNPSTNQGALIGFDASNNIWYRRLGSTTVATTSPAIPLNTLTHLEVSVDGSNVCRIFVNGILRRSLTVAAGISSAYQLLIGRERTTTTSTGQFHGFMPAIRLTRGATVRHTEDFTPPSFPFPTFGA